MRVVFPAPFSPNKPWIDLFFKKKSTLSFALTPLKIFVIPRISTTY